MCQVTASRQSLECSSLLDLLAEVMARMSDAESRKGKGGELSELHDGRWVGGFLMENEVNEDLI